MPPSPTNGKICYTDNTDHTDLHESKSLIVPIFEFVNLYHPCSSVVKLAFLCKAVVILKIGEISAYRRKAKFRTRILFRVLVLHA